MLLGDYPTNPGSVIVFGVIYVLTGWVFGFMSWYCFYKGYFVPHADFKGIQRGSKISTAVGVLSILPLFIASYSPGFALGFYVILTLIYILMQSLFKIKETSGEAD